MDLILLVGIIIGLAIFSMFNTFSNFTYEVKDGYIRIRWKVLKYIPFRSIDIKISDIQETRPFVFEKDILAGARVWGKLFIKSGVVLVLKRRSIRYWFANRIYITPDNPDEFIAEISQKSNR